MNQEPKIVFKKKIYIEGMKSMPIDCIACPFKIQIPRERGTIRCGAKNAMIVSLKMLVNYEERAKKCPLKVGTFLVMEGGNDE